MEEKERYIIGKGENIAVVDNDRKIIFTITTAKLQDLLNQQDKRIKELENMNARLSQGIYWGNGEHFCDVVKKYKQENQQLKQQLETFAHRISDQNEEILELKQKLNDLQKKIIEEIRDDMSKKIMEKQIKWGDNIQIGFICNAINECLDTILKKYGGKYA